MSDLFPTKRKKPKDPLEKFMLKNLGKIYDSDNVSEMSYKKKLIKKKDIVG